MKNNLVRKITELGQSIWLDYIRCDLISNGSLKKFIDEEGISGITSNPSIFMKAIAESTVYDRDILRLSSIKKNSTQIYESLSQLDVQNAADVLRPIYDKTFWKEGFVSLEVNPHLALNAQGTIDEARQLWMALDRPNVMIKIPATIHGLTAMQQLISEGININATLLFGLFRYEQVMESYISGLETRIGMGKSIAQISSVASFFLSRIDTLVDPFITNQMVIDTDTQEISKKIHGRVAISSAKVAYQMYKEFFSSERFKKLAEKGALPQRLLWASTSNKNPSFSDVRYIDEIIGYDTINTVPRETIASYCDHGDPKLRLEQNVIDAQWVMSSLSTVGLSIEAISQQLENEGVKNFIESFDDLLDSIGKKSTGNNKGRENE